MHIVLPWKSEDIEDAESAKGIGPGAAAGQNDLGKFSFRGGSTFVPLADVAVTNAAGGIKLRDANEDRVGLVITNNDPAVNIRVGDSTVTATKGVRLFAGSSMTITSTAAIYAISEGANVTVSLSEELG